MIPSLTPTPSFSRRQDALEVALFDLSPDHFTQNFDDLDWYLAAFVTLGSKREISMMCRHRHPDHKNTTSIAVPADEADPFSVLDELMEACSLRSEHIAWINDVLANSQRWQICRTDDNGAEFIITNTWSEEHARNLVNGLTDRGHKQFYWYQSVSVPPVHSLVVQDALDRQKLKPKRP